QVIKLEQDRLIYQARLQARFGRSWRRKAPVESLMPLRLARFGVPLAETAPAGLAAAGIEPALIPPAPVPVAPEPQHPELVAAPEPRAEHEHERGQEPEPRPEQPAQQGQPDQQEQQQEQPAGAHVSPWFAAQQPSYVPEEPHDQWYAEQQAYADQQAYANQQAYADEQAYLEQQQAYFDEHDQAAGPAGPEAEFQVPAGPGRTRPLGGQHLIPGPREEQAPEGEVRETAREDAPEELGPLPEASGLPDDVSREDAYFAAFRKYVSELGDYPNARQFGLYLMDLYGVTGQAGGPPAESTLRPYLRDFRGRYQEELDSPEYSA
ncbi:hypothetical protein, partial [Streptomyces longisporoflavus]